MKLALILVQLLDEEEDDEDYTDQLMIRAIVRDLVKMKVNGGRGGGFGRRPGTIAIFSFVTTSKLFEAAMFIANTKDAEDILAHSYLFDGPSRHTEIAGSRFAIDFRNASDEDRVEHDLGISHLRVNWSIRWP